MIRLAGKDPLNANQNEALVDSTGRLYVRSVSETEAQESVEKGDAFNLNTGKIALTSSTESGVFYFKNNMDRAFIVEFVAIGIGSAGTTSDLTDITFINGATTGTLISGATSADIVENRNTGSNKTLDDSLIYKGAEGNTITDGDDYIYVMQPSGTRVQYNIFTEIQKGGSFSVKMDTQTTSGTTNVYVAVVGHLKKFD
jgi:hypothetical protein